MKARDQEPLLIRPTWARIAAYYAAMVLLFAGPVWMLLRLNLFITRTDVVIPLVCLFLSVALGQKILFHEISIIDGVIFGPSGGMDRIRIPLREIEADGVGRGLFQGMGWTTIRSKSGSRIRLCKYFYRTENWARFTDILMESR